VNTATNQMDQVVQQNAAMVEQATAAAHSLKQEASRLNSLVGGFRISRGEVPNASAMRLIRAAQPSAREIVPARASPGPSTLFLRKTARS